jgi:hypothetical protein
MAISKRWSMLAVSAVTVGAVTLTGSPAYAGYDDSFGVNTADGCGGADFVDYGTWPNGSTNDDYVVVHDFCSDGHGVKAYAWLNGTYKGSKYNGNGLSGAPVYWDPLGNVGPNDEVGLKVCLVDGDSDPTPFACYSHTGMSSDG